jgi:predicted transcriptional regulator
MNVLILRWYDAGRTSHEIAEELNADTTDVRAILRRGGRQPSR